MWYVYILECQDKSLYTGVTDSLDRRFEEHKRGVAHYTSAHRPIKIVYTELFTSKVAALERERQIKGWTRAKKLALANGESELLKKL